MPFGKIVTICGLATTMAMAQENAVRVRSIRVLATDPQAVAVFYEKSFGMSEIRRPADTATFKEIVINSGVSTEAAKASATTPIVIATRPKEAPAGAMASLILQVADLQKTIAAAKANGGTLMRPAAENPSQKLSYAFVKDPDGNQIELVMSAK